MTMPAKGKRATMSGSQRAAAVLERLGRRYPDGARSALVFSNPLEMLVATILSAQCTDKKVNEVTRSLFQEYRSAADYAAADLSSIEAAIRPTGFFRQKAKSLKGCCRVLVERHGGQVPRDIESLTALPGVGRKTANVVKSAVWGDNDGIAVDTHVGRLARRLGLSKASEPAEIERDLVAVVPRDSWGDFSFLLIRHGRDTCTARRPLCAQCLLSDLCPSTGKAADIK